jgi:predicted nucleic acid-binding protein
MTRFVIGADVALRLARDKAQIAAQHQLVAPTLFRSHVLSLLYRAVRSGDLTWSEADAQLDYVRGLKLRFLGDRVLQRTAWKVARQLGWDDTFDAEYVALTQLQADAFVTLDAALAHSVDGLVVLAAFDELLAPP